MRHLSFMNKTVRNLLIVLLFLLPAQLGAQDARLYVGQSTTFVTPNPPRSDAAIYNSAWSSSHVSVSVTKRSEYSGEVYVDSYFTDTAEIRCDYYWYWYSGSYMMTNHATKYFTVACLPVTVRISSSSLKMNVGDTENLDCSYSPSNVNPRPTLTWRSTDTRVATVSGGYVKAVGTGSCEIEVLNNMGPKASCPVTVTDIEPKEIHISDSRITLGPDQTEQLSAKVYPSNASTTLTWTTDDSDVATVSRYGLVTGVAPGTATITVSTSNNLYDECIVTVKEVKAKSISLSESQLFVPEGSGKLLKATLTPSDATEKVTWSSSDESIATVSSGGYVNGVKSGKATITAKAGAVHASCSVTVQPQPDGISLPETLELPQGCTHTLKATLEPADAYSKLTWSSSSEYIATVSDNGDVTGKNMGEARITVRTENGLEATCSITVTDPIPPTDVRLQRSKLKLVTGYCYQLTPYLRPDDAYSSYTWDTEDPSVATVSDKGLVRAVSSGETRVTVKTKNGLEASCIVKVDDPEDADSELPAVASKISTIKDIALKALNTRPQ